MTDFLTQDIIEGRNWRGLERAVARMLSHAGWNNISIVGRSGDKGADIIGSFDNGERLTSWVIQVKSVSGPDYVGPKAIDEAVNAQPYYNVSNICVATNGDFTESAKKRKQTLDYNGFPTELWNGAFLKLMVNELPARSLSYKNPHEYQQKIIDRVVDDFKKGSRKGLYVVATGLGKTLIAASIANELWTLGVRRILVLCHVKELALQLEQGFWSQLDKSIPTSFFFEGKYPKTSEGITFGLYQTLYGTLSGLSPDTYDVIIVDEAHHAPSGCFSTCLNYLKPKYILGMTATPWRGDGKDICDIFGKPLETVSLVDGMAMGFLSKVDYHILCDNINWDEMQKMSKLSLSIKDLNKRLFLPERDDAAISEILKIIKTINNPKIAVFSPTIDHSIKFSEMLNAAGISSQPLSSKKPEEGYIRRRKIMDFATGKLMAITAVDVLNEGIDVPDVNVLVFLRATHSRRIFIQQLGRGLRIADNKDHVTVLDFVSDVRRIADVIEIDSEAKEKGTEKEILFLKEGIVSFSNRHFEHFVTAWLEDVADLGDSSDSAKLSFPEVD